MGRGSSRSLGVSSGHFLSCFNGYCVWPKSVRFPTRVYLLITRFFEVIHRQIFGCGLGVNAVAHWTLHKGILGMPSYLEGSVAVIEDADQFILRYTQEGPT